MADLRLKKIEMRNWMTVKSSVVEFPEKGLILVIGSNLASEGKMESVGAGKTALGEALARTLLGVTGRYAHLGYYLSDSEKKDMYVKLDAELLSKPLVVEMGYRCKELIGDGEALRFRHGEGDPFQAANADQTREHLQKTLQVTPELANWTAFVDGDRLKFNKISQEDSVNLLMTALTQPPWTQFYREAAKKLEAANRQVAVSTQALGRAKESLELFRQELEKARIDHQRAVEAHERQLLERDDKIAQIKKLISGERSAIKEAEAEMARIKKQLKLLEDQKAVYNHKCEIERCNLRDKLALTDESWAELIRVRSARMSAMDQAEKLLRQMRKVPKNCPTCGKVWDKAHSDEEIAKAEKAVAEAQQVFDQADGEYLDQDKVRREIIARIAKLERQMREDGSVDDIRSLANSHECNEELARDLNASIHARELQIARLESEIDTSFVNKKIAIVEERAKTLATGETAVEVNAADLVMDQEAQKVVQYWHKAFSPTGIPNMILADAIPLMNRVAQRISAVMTGGTLQVSYSTTRDLARGESKAQLVTKVVNRIGSKRIEGSSKGEGGLTNLIIAENLNEIGQVSNRVGFRFYDEITSGQDAVVRRSIFAYLKEIAKQMGILIFVVDHHPEAANFADYVLLATKTKEKGTTYTWR